MIVCHCKRIRERQVRRSVRAGAVTLPALCRSTGAGKACGGCHRALREIIESEQGRAAVRETAALVRLETAS
ncbi:MAG: (2Fe-2S)-binding protein [Myxococcales bacterium]|nr:(2Fe-2S)-binding protein [Myxococcales bacterium]